MKSYVLAFWVLAVNLPTTGLAAVDVVCEQIGSPRFVGGQIVVGIAIQRGEEARRPMSVEVWDDFPTEYSARSQGAVLEGNPGDLVEFGLKKITRLIPIENELTTFLYYPMGEVGGWLRSGRLPDSPIQYKVYVRLTVEDTQMIQEFEFEVGIPESRGGTEILEGFWSGELCDGPTIGSCSVRRESPLRAAFWDRNQYSDSEYSFDLAFPGAFSMDGARIVRIANRTQSTDPKIREGELRDFLREQQVRRERCPATSTRQRALLSLVELPVKVRAGVSTLDSVPRKELESTSRYLEMVLVDAVESVTSE